MPRIFGRKRDVASEASVLLPATGEMSPAKTLQRNKFNDESFVANCRKKETTTAADSLMAVAPPTQVPYGYDYSAFYSPEMMWMQVPQPQLPPRGYMMPMPASPGWHFQQHRINQRHQHRLFDNFQRNFMWKFMPY